MSIAGKVFGIGTIPFLSIVVLLNVRLLLLIILPYIYCPPALTPERLAVFNECIAFARTRNEEITISLSTGLWVTVDGKRYKLDGKHYKLSKGIPSERKRAEKALTPEEINQMENLYHKLRGIRFPLFKRHGDLLLFYNLTNCLGPIHPRWRYVLPVSPGVLFSLNGENPNEINDEFIDSLKPFFKIKGNWYMSRHLMRSPPRYSSASIPKALFDHSLRVEGINLDETVAEELTRQ
jgi:hypothetical protein